MHIICFVVETGASRVSPLESEIQQGSVALWLFLPFKEKTQNVHLQSITDTFLTYTIFHFNPLPCWKVVLTRV